MKTPNAIINTTCRGTPSGDTTWSSIMVPISVPVVLPSSDRARFLRLKPVASVGAELGSGAVASRARKRWISACASLYFASSSALACACGSAAAAMGTGGRTAGAGGGGDGGVMSASALRSTGGSSCVSVTSSGAAENSFVGSTSSRGAAGSRVSSSSGLYSGIGSTCPFVIGCWRTVSNRYWSN